ncbi:hypothetical protein AWB74_06064 [Caballeronia arvi]|uniref:Uncharacterized protein n=1 Tax=Caballeronia arvi TaxID=1777135 RepID=A0A158KKW6_9BURK|nr:hypothetical protein AWB74_06064 [Caballeronia arvi]
MEGGAKWHISKIKKSLKNQTIGELRENHQSYLGGSGEGSEEPWIPAQSSNHLSVGLVIA